MNFVSKDNDAFQQQQPTYYLAPNFTTRPFPDGPLELGTFVEDIKQCYPINQGIDNRVPISADLRYRDTKEDINASLKQSHSGEAGILAKVLDHSIGGEASLKRKKSDDDVYKIERLETVYFYPQPSYIKTGLQLPDVKEYLDLERYKKPVYLITGLKIAWGATVSTERGSSNENKVEGFVAAPKEFADVSVGAKASTSGDSDVSSSFGKPADFVLGIQVQKVYHKKRFYSKDQVLTVERMAKGAVLVDNDEPEAGDDSEDNFVVMELDDVDTEGLVPWVINVSGGKDEKWFIPSKDYIC